MQAKPKQTRGKRCKSCQGLFNPDPRTKGKQKYCSKPECQTKRQRQNGKDWRKRNSDCLAYQQEQSRQWHRDHPDCFWAHSHDRLHSNNSPEILTPLQ